MVRAMFEVTEVTKYPHNGATVKLTARYDDSIPEEKRYHAATPSGSIEMFINNPGALDFFVPGKKVYIDFTAASVIDANPLL